MANTGSTFTSTQEDHIVVWLTALAITIHIAEAALPSPLPGVKPGLANIVTLIAVYFFGWRIAVWVSLLRILVGSLIIGSFLSPTFFLSLSGAICSLFVLRLALWWSKRVPVLRFSTIGYSIMAAMAHMYGQFWVAYWLFIHHDGIFHILPILMTVSVIFGIVSGIIAKEVIRRLELRLDLQPY